MDPPQFPLSQLSEPTDCPPAPIPLWTQLGILPILWNIKFHPKKGTFWVKPIPNLPSEPGLSLGPTRGGFVTFTTRGQQRPLVWCPRLPFIPILTIYPKKKLQPREFSPHPQIPAMPRDPSRCIPTFPGFFSLFFYTQNHNFLPSFLSHFSSLFFLFSLL